mmetsp:Transcript_12197/g.32742  ORF Transcript_12197/g.32742 Transcript_12197/m.32742 type:complete len:218 (-) Transcript_12197:1586-2239(-)
MYSLITARRRSPSLHAASAAAPCRLSTVLSDGVTATALMDSALMPPGVEPAEPDPPKLHCGCGREAPAEGEPEAPPSCDPGGSPSAPPAAARNAPAQPAGADTVVAQSPSSPALGACAKGGWSSGESAAASTGEKALARRRLRARCSWDRLASLASPVWMVDPSSPDPSSLPASQASWRLIRGGESAAGAPASGPLVRARLASPAAASGCALASGAL